MALTNDTNLTILPTELYPVIFAHLKAGQLCILGCVSKALAAIALQYASKLNGGNLIGVVTIPRYLRENLKWEILAQHSSQCAPTGVVSINASFNHITANFIAELKEKKIQGSDAVNLSQLFDETKHQQNHFLKCPFIAIYDLGTGHLSPNQLEYAIVDAFRYAEICSHKDLDIVSTLLFKHSHGPEIAVQPEGGLGYLLRTGICRGCVNYWTDEERLKIVKMFFAHPNGKNILASDLQTVAKYVHETQDSDAEVAEVISRHPNAKNMSNCTIL